MAEPTDARDHTPIHFETTRLHDHEVTVARDAEGHIVFPSYVPQETTPPVSPTYPAYSTIPPKAHDTKPAPNRDQQSEDYNPTRKVQTGPTQPSVSARPPTRTWKSENPPGENKNTMKRAGKATSGENHTPRGDEASSSSDGWSSSSDEEDHHTHGRRDADDDHYRRFHVGNQNYRTKGKISKRDGRLNISVKDMSNTGYLAKALGTAVKKVIPKTDGASTSQDKRQSIVSTISAKQGRVADTLPCPKLNIVIMVIGSRGDAQPFLKIGKELKEKYGHRVRIATHPAFREFVEKDSGLEFFSVGGDPSELMAFMVKNPGMIPTLETVKAGDIGRRRAAMAEMFGGFWRACINATDDERDSRNVKMMGARDPFVADAIIANPPSFAHLHCAEALGIPLHLMFTFPYTPTQAFPHPLASIKKSNVDAGYTNFISYPLVEMMVWQGLGDLVNEFRVKTLGLDPVSTLWAPGATYRLHVPFTYLWSPGLVPKPEDWGSEIDIAGFVFLDLASSFKPPDELAKFLEESEEPPIYIGFGSIVVDDADRFTDMIFKAVKLAGVRALVSKGWGGIGGDGLDVPEGIFMLDNTPHDWLFPKVRACVIHGGAGTTAIALKCGKPTMIVPFFGDQNFWGSMVANANAGPEPVPYKELTEESLAEGIKYCLTDEAVQGAQKIAKGIEAEGDGAENACKAFHKNLVLSGKNSMRCSILEDRVAVWQLKDTSLRLSPMAAEFAIRKGYFPWKKLRLLRHNEWNDFEGPGEPVTGVAGSLIGSMGEIFGGVGGVPWRVAKGNEKRRERKERRRKREEKKKNRGDDSDSRKTEAAAKEADDGKGKGHEEEDGKGAGDASSPPKTEATDHVDRSTEVISSAGDDPKRQKHAKFEDQDEDEWEKLASPTKTATSKAPTLTRGDTQLTQLTVSTTGGGPDNSAEQFAHEVGRGAKKSASALARAPVDFSVALAQGFHNAPRLYGDDTVRRPTRVTGMRSGLRAAKHEFVYGIYDGWTGVVRLPVRGAREGGVGGFVRGVGMGLTGFVLKDIAALVGPVGYTLKGVVKQLETNTDKINKRRIRKARIVQGRMEIGLLKGHELVKKEGYVDRGWEVMTRLWNVLEEREKREQKKKMIKIRIRKSKTLRRRGLGVAFESVRTAGEALTALKKNPEARLEDVFGDDEGRNAEGGDAGKSRVVDAKAKHQKEGKGDSDSAEKRSWWKWRKESKDKDAKLENGGVLTSYEEDGKGKGKGKDVDYSPAPEEKTDDGEEVDHEQSRHEARGIRESAPSEARRKEETKEGEGGSSAADEAANGTAIHGSTST